MISPTNITLVVLLTLTVLFGGLSYHFYGAKTKAEVSLGVAVDANKTLKNSLNLQVESCKIDDTTIAKVQAEKQELQNQIDDVTNQIAALKTGLKNPRPIVKSGINQNEETPPLVGPELLSDALVQLLHESYCNVEPDSCLPTK